MSSRGCKLCCGSIILARLKAAALCFGPTFGFVVDAACQLWCWMICNADHFLSHTHTHTRAVPAAKSHGKVHAAPLKLPTIY